MTNIGSANIGRPNIGSDKYRMRKNRKTKNRKTKYRMNKNRKRKYRKNKYRKDQNLGRTRIGRTTFWNNKTKNALFVKIAQSRTKLHNIAENSTKLSFDKNAHLYKIAFSQKKHFCPTNVDLTKSVHFHQNCSF